VPGVHEKHQGQQPAYLGIVGQPSVQAPGQADRLVGHVDSHQGGARRGGVALVEDQVQHPENCLQPAFQVAGGRQGEGNAAVFDRLFRPGDSAGYGLLRPEQGARNLRRAEPSDRPQREGDLRRRRQRWVAAHEQQDERVVGLARTALVCLGRAELNQRPFGDRVFPAAAGLLGTQHVGKPAGGDRDQPCLGAGGQPLSGPLHRGRQERLLRGVLGQVEVAVTPDKRAEDLRRQRAQQVPDLGSAQCRPPFALSLRSPAGARRPA
jgi:hypothetical protein